MNELEKVREAANRLRAIQIGDAFPPPDWWRALGDAMLYLVERLDQRLTDEHPEEARQ